MMMINIKRAVAKVYQPIKRSSIKEKGIPAIAKPPIYAYPQYLSFNPTITPGIIVVKMTVRYDQICIESKITSMFIQEAKKPTIIHITVKIVNLNSGSGLPTVCSLPLLIIIKSKRVFFAYITSILLDVINILNYHFNLSNDIVNNTIDLIYKVLNIYYL
jgi:hypothetical protein